VPIALARWAKDEPAVLADSASTGNVYLHPNCGTASYEQWKFLPVAPSGAKLYLLENGYQVNGVNDCLQITPEATEGGCSPENHSAVLEYVSLSSSAALSPTWRVPQKLS
jgi:hypothetical protein